MDAARGRSGPVTETHACAGYNDAMFGIFRRQDSSFRDDGNFLLARVRTARNGEVIPVRISKSSEMSPAPGGYFVRKVLVGPDTLDEATLEVTTNRAHKVTQATVDGGELVPVSDWS